MILYQGLFFPIIGVAEIMKPQGVSRNCGRRIIFQICKRQRTKTEPLQFFGRQSRKLIHWKIKTDPAAAHINYPVTDILQSVEPVFGDQDSFAT